MSRYGMGVDVSRCTGCFACVVACKSENSTRPGVAWIRIREEEKGEYPNVSRRYVPLLCMQCGEAPCAEACPMGAVSKSKRGIVAVDPGACDCGELGSCIPACPVNALSINGGQRVYFPELLTPHEKDAYAAHRDGVAEKCTFCSHRVEAGDLPACVQSCPSRALLFGDLDDAYGALSRLVSSGRARPLVDVQNLDPAVFYILE